MFITYCRTSHLYIAPVLLDERRIYRFYHHPDVGILASVLPRMLVCDAVRKELHTSFAHDKFLLASAFCEKTHVRTKEATAVIAHLQPPFSAGLLRHFATFPQVLRTMPKDRQRLLVLKIWQFLADNGREIDVVSE